MNIYIEYIIVFALSNGMQLTALIAIAFFFIFLKKDKLLFQSFFGYTMLFCAFQSTLPIFSLFSLEDITIVAKDHIEAEWMRLITYATVPLFELFVYTLVWQDTPAKTCIRKLIIREIPFFMCIVLYAFNWQYAYELGTYYFIIYVLWIYIYLQLLIKRYHNRLYNSHSDIENRELKWVQYYMISLVFIAAIYAMVSYLHFRHLIIIFRIVSVGFYTFVAIKISSQRATDTEALAETYASKNIILDIIDNEGQTNEPTEKGIEKAPLSQDVLDSIGEKLSKIMKEQKIYLNRDITIKDISMAVGTNTSYLSYYINKVKGKTFTTYINDLRLLNAEMLLRGDTSLSIEDVALKSGFNSITTMQRLFQERNHCTPSQFRLGHDTTEINSITKEIELSNISSNEGIKKMIEKVESLYPGFSSKLAAKYPQLTKREHQLCHFIILGYSNVEISQALGINESSLNVTRSRMRAKMNLKRSDNLMLLLTQIANK